MRKQVFKKQTRDRNAQSGAFVSLSKKEQKERITKSAEAFAKNYYHVMKKLAKE